MTSPRESGVREQRDACAGDGNDGSQYTTRVDGGCFVEESTSSVISGPLEDKSPERGVQTGHGDQLSRTRGRVHDGFGWRRGSKMTEGVQDEVVAEGDEDKLGRRMTCTWCAQLKRKSSRS